MDECSPWISRIFWPLTLTGFTVLWPGERKRVHKLKEAGTLLESVTKVLHTAGLGTHSFRATRFVFGGRDEHLNNHTVVFLPQSLLSNLQDHPSRAASSQASERLLEGEKGHRCIFTSPTYSPHSSPNQAIFSLQRPFA